MTTFENKTTINASPQTVWQTLADIGGISNWAQVIVDSPVTGTPGVGAVRKCTLLDGMQIEETFDAWDHQQKIGYEVAGLPVPMASTWRLEAVGDATVVSYLGELKTDNQEMASALSEKLSGMSQFLLAALKHNVETGDVLTPPQ